ncbi:PAS domain S-box protein [Chloroflexota bacterium]
MKQASFTKPTIAGKLWLGFGLLLLILAVTLVIYYWQTQRTDSYIAQVVEIQESRQQAVLEMRLNAANIARSVSDYMRDGDPTHLEKARDFEAGFKISAARFNELSQTDGQKVLGQEIDKLYEEFRGEAHETTALMGQQHTTLLSFQEGMKEVSFSIYEMHQATIEGTPPDALKKLEASINMQSSLDKVSIAIETYTSERDPGLRQEVLDGQEEFKRFGAMYRETSLSAYEDSWLTHIDQKFEGVISDSIEILAFIDNLHELLAQFEQSFQKIDAYLDEQVFPLVHAEVLAASENMQDSTSSAGKWLLALVGIGVVTGIAATFIISREVTGPIRDLINGATIVESGRINYRFNINAKGEFSQLAVALNKMLNNLGRLHEMLEDSEEQAWALLDVTNDAVILTDIRGAILASNEAAAERFGMSIEQMINESFYDLLPAELTASTKAHVADAIHLRKPIHYEDEWEGKIIDRNILPMFDQKGEITRIAIFSRDVTVRKWVEDVTEQLGRRNELILQAAGEGIYGLDTQGITTFVNPAAARMLGYDPGDLIGKRHHELVHYAKPNGKPYPYEQCPIYAAFKDGAVHTNVDNEVFWQKDGTCFPVEYTSTPIIEGDRVLGAVVTFRDITDRKLIEKVVYQSEEKYRSIVESAASLIISVDQAGFIIDCNTRVQQTLGYERSEIIGQRLVGFVHPDEHSNAENLLKDVLTTGFEYDNHYRMVLKDGSFIDANMNAAVAKDVNGEYIRTICMIDKIIGQVRE